MTYILWKYFAVSEPVTVFKFIMRSCSEDSITCGEKQ